jgi:hypothetical protein
MKQTAVEWLEMEIVKLEAKYAIVGEIYELCEQAKEMEKKEILKRQLFIGKVSEIIGFEKTLELWQETLNEII